MWGWHCNPAKHTRQNGNKTSNLEHSRFFSESPSDDSSVATRSMCACRSLSQCVSCLLSVLIMTSCSSICFACCCSCASVLGSVPRIGELATDVAGVDGASCDELVSVIPTDEAELGCCSWSEGIAFGAGGMGTVGGGVGGGIFMLATPFARENAKFTFVRGGLSKMGVAGVCI